MFDAPARASRFSRTTAAKLGAFSTKPRGWRSRVAEVGVLVGLLTPALMLAPQVAAAAGRTYSAKISPTAAQTGSTATYTATVTNNSALGALIGMKTATITVPSGFTITGVGAASPSSWTGSRSGNTITLTSRLLLPGSSASVPITAKAPAAPGGYTWATSSSGVLGPFKRVGPQANPPPCVESIVSTPFDSDNDGDSGALLNGDDIPIVTVTIDAPQGDPKFSG